MITDKNLSAELIAKRLEHVITDTMLKRGERRSTICEHWQLNDAHVGNVINGHKEITLTIVKALLKNGVNANYILAGLGPMYEADYEIPTAARLLAKMKGHKDAVVKSRKRVR